MGQINTNNYPTVDSLADADLLIVENAIHGTGTTTPKQLRENAIGTDTLETTAQTVTGAINELKNEMASAGHTLAGVGHKTAYDSASYTIDSDIILHRAPKGMDRVLLFLDERITRPLNLTIYGESYSDEYTIPLSINSSVWEPPAYMDGICILEYHEFEEDFALIAMYEAVTGSNGVVSISKGGTGNSYGYIRTGRATGSNVGYGATIEGVDNTASNSYAHAGGQGVFAEGLHSFAHGQYVNAGSAQQTAFGRYNDNKAANLFEIGNGTADNARSNALEVTADGHVLDGNGNDLQSVAALEQSASGNPIVVNAQGIDAKELSVELEPIQDLHGYDHPWAGGAGKNKLNNTGTTGTVNNVVFTMNSDGTVSLANTSNDITLKNLTDVNGIEHLFAEGSYILSDGITTAGIGLYLQGKKGADGTWANITNTITAHSIAVTINYNTYDYFRVYAFVANNTNTDGVVIKPMLRLSTESDATFAPYANICPISGRTEASVVTRNEDNTDSHTVTIQLGQTVYGGTLNVTTGVLTITWAARVFTGADGESYNSYGSSHIFFKLSDITDAKAASSGSVIGNIMSNEMPSISYNNVYGGNYGIAVDASGNIYLFISDDITTSAGLKTWLASNNLQVVYELATPTTIQLTPTQLKLLEGYNYITADGDMQLVYIPESVLPTPPTADGNYKLRCTVSNGVPSFSWVSDT